MQKVNPMYLPSLAVVDYNRQTASAANASCLTRICFVSLARTIAIIGPISPIATTSVIHHLPQRLFGFTIPAKCIIRVHATSNKDIFIHLREP
jgi:hypothetical protein